MANTKPLELDNILSKDNMACKISENYMSWEMYRATKVTEFKEVQQYIFATDTTKTNNSKLPWSNKTTIPKLCQIRDNLYSNYMATMFPKRKWLIWEADTEKDDEVEKKKAIESYMAWVVDREEFYDEVAKLVLDYIDYGNCFSTVEWQDNRKETNGSIQGGYVGPILRRISPLDIVFNPIAPSFASAAKIIRSFVSIGEVKEMLERLSSDPSEREDAEKLYNYLKNVRDQVASYTQGDIAVKDEIFQISGFTDYRSYLASGYVEVLTFYGDIYDEINDKYLRNQIVKIVDRHKIISMKDNPSAFGTAPIYHSGWRVRQDNLWAMGPLDNLVGMQYRIDHLENMKADVFDLIAYPPLKIKGYVEDFEWGPFQRIIVSEEGDVELMSPDVQALQADTQIAILEQKMEEMAGSPREAMGFRSPGEKTKYEVQVLENAIGRIFQNKTAQLERQQIEQALNGMLELAKRNMDVSTIRVFNDDVKLNVFRTLNRDDITGVGRIKPIAARHFAEQANLVQNITSFFASPVAQIISPHVSTERLARLMEQILDLEPYNVIEPYIAITEQADAQRIANVNEEEVGMETLTSAGIQEDDFDLPQ